ncbi:MAG: hypothetical protein ACXW1M_02310 [Acidimicrobiia bacterium]
MDFVDEALASAFFAESAFLELDVDEESGVVAESGDDVPEPDSELPELESDELESEDPDSEDPDSEDPDSESCFAAFTVDDDRLSVL